MWEAKVSVYNKAAHCRRAENTPSDKSDDMILWIKVWKTTTLADVHTEFLKVVLVCGSEDSNVQF